MKQYKAVGVKEAAQEIAVQLSTQECMQLVNKMLGNSMDKLAADSLFMRRVLDVALDVNRESPISVALPMHEAVRTAMAKVYEVNSRDIDSVALEIFKHGNSDISIDIARRGALNGLCIVVLIHLIEGYLACVDPAGDDLKYIRHLLINKNDKPA